MVRLLELKPGLLQLDLDLLELGLCVLELDLCLVEAVLELLEASCCFFFFGLECVVGGGELGAGERFRRLSAIRFQRSWRWRWKL